MDSIRKLFCPTTKNTFPGLHTPKSSAKRPLPFPNDEFECSKSCEASVVEPLPKPLPQPGAHIETAVEPLPKPLPKPCEESVTPARKRRRIDHLAQAHQDALRQLNSTAAEMHQQLNSYAPAVAETGSAVQLGKVTESVSGIMEVLPQLANTFDEVVVVACEMSMDDASTVAQAIARAAKAEQRMNSAELARREVEEKLRAGAAAQIDDFTSMCQPAQTEEHLLAMQRAEQAEERLAVAERARREAEEKLAALEAKHSTQDDEWAMHRAPQPEDESAWEFKANTESQDYTWALQRAERAEENLVAAEQAKMEAEVKLAALEAKTATAVIDEHEDRLAAAFQARREAEEKLAALEAEKAEQVLDCIQVKARACELEDKLAAVESARIEIQNAHQVAVASQQELQDKLAKSEKNLKHIQEKASQLERETSDLKRSQMEAEDLKMKTRRAAERRAKLAAHEQRGRELTEQFGRLFDEIDKNGSCNGYLSHNDLKHFVATKDPAMRLKLGIGRWREFLLEADIDGDGRISRGEFIAHFTRTNLDPVKCYGALFDAIDCHGDGFLSFGEVRDYHWYKNPHLFELLGINNYSELVETLDTDGDGRISRDEFISHFIKQESFRSALRL